MDDFLEDKPNSKRAAKHVFRGHRRLFLLVFAIAILWQSVSFLHLQLGTYLTDLEKDFKVILAVQGTPSNERLSDIGESLSNKDDIETVKLFSPEDALSVVKERNPQLASSVLLLGKSKMPAYFEIKLGYKAINNIVPFVDNLSAEYKELTARYNADHARLIFYTSLCSKILNIAAACAALLFLAFMFMVEAYPCNTTKHLFTGVLSGLGAAAASGLLFAALLYPTGLLAEAFAHFTTVERQALLFIFCGLMGWTLTKWQKF